VYTDQKECLCTCWGKYLSIDIYSVKECTETSLRGSYSVFSQINNTFSAKSMQWPRCAPLCIPPCLMHCAGKGNLIHLLEILRYTVNSRVGGEHRKDWQLGAILWAKQQLQTKINTLGGLNEIMSVKLLVNGSTPAIVMMTQLAKFNRCKCEFLASML
jgi:hypothetical protein